NANFSWYDAETGGNEVATGNQYIPTITTAGTTSFWVGGTLTNALGCDYTISPRQEVQVVLNQLPDFPTVSNNGNCVNTEVTFTASGGATGASYNWYEADDTFIESGATFTTPTLSNTTDYKVSATLNGCEGPKLTVSAVIGTVPGAAGGGSVSRCGPGTVTLTATLGTNASDIRWFDALTGGNELGTGTQFTSPSISTSTFYYAESVAGTCAAVTRHPIEAIILNQTTYYEDADNDSLGDPASSVQDCTKPDGYVENSADQCPTVFSPTNDCSAPPGDPSDWNYVYSRSYQTEETASTSPFFDPNDHLIQDITYFDGLGRPIQQNGIDQSPLKNDIIVHTQYDGFGRAEKEYLPFATIDTNPQGSYRLDALTPTEDHYNVVKYQNTINPYSQKKFEDSPLNRVLKQAAPGAAWAMDAGHEIEFDYSSNNTSNDNVKRFNVTLNLANLTYTPTLVANGNYAAGELMKMVTKDENHDPADGNLHTTEEFTDKQGRVVLKRTYALVGGSQEAHDTYYVYDDFGNLSYVLPPKMDGNESNMNELGYQYIYDDRNRLVEKRIPGKEKEYIVYNKLDQPIMTQDANQRLNGEWLFTKYDAFGRVTYTGKATDARGRTAVQNDVNSISGDLWVSKGAAQSYGGTTIYYNNGAYPSATSPVTTLDEILTINYYDDYNFDLAGGATSATVFGIASASNVRSLATGSKVKVLDPTANSTQAWITTVSLYDEKARPIYSYANNSYLGTVDIVKIQLDFVGRTLKSRTSHTRSGNTIVTIDNFTYDHVGRLLAQTQCIGDATLGDNCDGAGGGGAPIDLILSGTIDTDNIATNSIVIQADATIVPATVLSVDPNATGGDGNAELIVLNFYDELGRLEIKKVGGVANTSNVLNSNGLQTVNYNYNVRDWLTGINDNGPYDNDLTINGNDLFAFKIDYENPVAGGTPLYNGNISKTHWRTNNDNTSLRWYTYTYDALNRITSGIDNTNDDRYSLTGVTYDKNGNILTLSRKGHTGIDANGLVTGYGDMDLLSYSYENNQMSNQLASVTDGISGPAGDGGFTDGNTTGDDYNYDTNGNMTQDLNKGIAANGISYNHLNLPEQVIISGGSISYIYDATGVKMKKTVSTGTVTDYAGNYIYENNVLQFMSHPEGYSEPNSSNWDYIYQYKDHLGNVRLSYKDVSSNSTPTLEIQEENNYYPFGLKHKGYNSVVNGRNHQYGYLDQEEQNELGLNWLTFRHRNYNPEIGRFFGVDPISEDFLSISNYQFAHNSPIWKIEIEGLEGEISPDIPGAVDVPNHEPVEGHTNTGSNNIVAGAVAANFGHSFLAQAFVYNYANGKGEPMTLNENGMETVRASPVSIFRGSGSGGRAINRRIAEKARFNVALSSIKPGESTYFENDILAKANNQGTLGNFTIYFQGTLTKDENGKDWSFDGQMSFYDLWDLDKKEGNQRTQSSEDATAIGSKLLKGGKGFEIFSHNVDVKQTSKDSHVDWFNGKSSETKKTIHNRVPNWLTKIIEEWLKD
ncbi:MAG: DUF6443 domain-containing protein, partial [Maribacter sp.]|uniref:DUF6443 domain-containing protein n=1 Tax=Maribacter sp. TaxID=1897614 RepID=UPI00329909A8